MVIVMVDPLSTHFPESAFSPALVASYCIQPAYQRPRSAMIAAECSNCQNDRATGRLVYFLFVSDGFTLPVGSACSYFCVFMTAYPLSFDALSCNLNYSLNLSPVYHEPGNTLHFSRFFVTSNQRGHAETKPWRWVQTQMRTIYLRNELLVEFTRAMLNLCRGHRSCHTPTFM